MVGFLVVFNQYCLSYVKATKSFRTRKKQLKLPKFKSEDAERDFWAQVDIGDYYDADDFRKVSFPNLKPTTRNISIRFPEYVLLAVKEEANRMGVPYQALIKEAVAQKFMAK